MSDPARHRTLEVMASLLERWSDLSELIGSLARLRDTVGVLSMTAGVEPGAGVGGTPAWEIVLQNDLRQLGSNGSVGRLLDRRVAELGLEELLTPTASGRGRAAFVALASGTSTEVAFRGALPTEARLGPVAHTLPLLALLDGGEPAGLLATTRDAIVVRESELGVVRDVDRIELEPWVGDWWPEMKGPARANPQRGQEIVSQRDRYERRVLEAYRHTLDEAVGTVGTLARTRKWTRAVVAGDARRTDALERGLREQGLATTRIEANLEGIRPKDAVGRLEDALRALVHSQQLERARLAVSGSDGPSRGSCGLAGVLTALPGGRVEELLVETDREFLGLVGPDETLSTADGADGDVDLTDLVVAQALATGASVTPVDASGTGVLAECGGIAARLRW